MSLIDILNDKLSKMTQEELDAEYESITHRKFYDRWVEKFHNLSSKKRKYIVKKVYDKYESDDYIKSEYNKGYEPRTPLYDIFLEYAMKYGKEYDIEFNSYFPTERYIFDGIVIQIMFGQGSVIDLFLTEDDWNSYKEKIINK